ncbi:hypothetical protein H2203_008032 [Taxawa tesnikishii (nom. ined.)]|nr:hypothetical protein H2203_008032 [Dothideales sp. JES 119]
MVKADVKRNYYADLELSTDATVEDIKKQYRKLALKYHPDRNPGKEAECNPKFQAIQAAHEVLEDPVTKAKYDADRRKAGLFPPTYSRPAAPPRTNPYQATSAWPPPPRRTAPPTNTWRSTTSGQPPPNGPDRFTNFPRPSPTSKRDTTQERANVFNAWQNMNHASKPQPQAQPQAQTTPNRPCPPPRADTKFPSEEEIRAGMNYRRPPPAYEAEQKRSAWAQFNASQQTKPGMTRSASTRTPRKTGFDPTAPGSDERQASTAGYTSRTRTEESAFAYPPPPPPPREGKPDPLRQFKSNEDVPYSEGNRIRTPYSSYIGEQTRLSSDPLRRSQSTRDATKMHGTPTHRAQSQRNHSSSPPQRKPATQGSKPPKPFVVYSSSSESDSEDSTATSPEPSRPAEQPEEDNPFLRPNNRPMKKPVSPTRRYNVPPPRVASESDSGFSSSTAPNLGNPASTANEQKSSIFTFPVNSETFVSNVGARSRSEEHINTSFSPAGWSAQFTANNATDYFAAPPPTGRKPVSPMRRNRDGSQTAATDPSTTGLNGAGINTSAVGTNSPFFPPPPPPPLPPKVSEQTVPLSHPRPIPNQGGFSAQQWTEAMKDPSWVSEAVRPASPARPTSSRGSSATRRVSKTMKSTMTPKPAAVETLDEKEEDKATKEANAATEKEEGEVTDAASAAATPAADAMDIDPPAAAAPPPKSTPAVISKEPRLYSVPPSQWRQSQGVAAADGGAARPSSEPQPRKNSATFQASIADLGNVAPFNNTSGGGLDGLDDMTTTLPFLSKASDAHPTVSFEPRLLVLPQVPIPPDAPTKLTKASWHAYCQAMAKYMNKFHDTFNGPLMAHFNARQATGSYAATHSAQSLEAIGEGSRFAGAAGFMSYMQAIREDEKMREHWAYGWDKHMDVMKRFEGVKKRVKHISENSGLSEA